MGAFGALGSGNSSSERTAIPASYLMDMKAGESCKRRGVLPEIQVSSQSRRYRSSSKVRDVRKYVNS